MMKRFMGLFLASLPILILSACGGGSSGSSSGGGAPSANTEAMVVTEKVSVVDAQAAPSANRESRLARIFKDAAALPASSDYKRDATNVYVEERSTEGFNTVNEILCMIGQTKYNAMLNRGAYKAQVDAKGKMVLPPGCAEAYQKYLQLDPKGPYSADAKGVLTAAGVMK